MTAPGATVASVGRRLLTLRWLPGTLLVVVAVLVCLRLGWWQWDRTRDQDGTLQNLAYAILWPAFGASFIYMWWRFVSLETRRDSDDDAELDAAIAGVLDEADQGSARGTGDGEPGPAEEPAPAREQAAAVTENTDEQDDLEYFVGTVEVDEDDDPELAAYNRALAALAEEDRRRAG